MSSWIMCHIITRKKTLQFRRKLDFSNFSHETCKNFSIFFIMVKLTLTKMTKKSLLWGADMFFRLDRSIAFSYFIAFPWYFFFILKNSIPPDDCECRHFWTAASFVSFYRVFRGFGCQSEKTILLLKCHRSWEVDALAILTKAAVFLYVDSLKIRCWFIDFFATSLESRRAARFLLEFFQQPAWEKVWLFLFFQKPTLV